MSDLTRYDLEYLSEDGETSKMAIRPDGDYVLYEDYAALLHRTEQAEREWDEA